MEYSGSMTPFSKNVKEISLIKQAYIQILTHNICVNNTLNPFFFHQNKSCRGSSYPTTIFKTSRIR